MDSTLFTTPEQETLLVATKGTIAFSELLEKAENISTECLDYKVRVATDTPTMRVDRDLNFTFKTVEEEVIKTPFSRYAFGQLCTKLEVPVRYVERCFKEGEVDLATDNLNTWLENYQKSLLIRTHQGRARGILSDRYSPFDTPEILDVITRTLDVDDYLVKGYYISPERFHIRLTQRTMMKVNGEDLFAGIQIDSSDVGRSTLLVRFFIFKQVCTNGLCISKDSGLLFTQKHIGISKEEFSSELEVAVAKLPEIIQSFEEAIKESEQEEILVGENSPVLTMLSTQIKLSEKQVERTLEIMNDKYEQTHWGLINSLTELAQDFSLERRIEIENMAGNLLLSKVA